MICLSWEITALRTGVKLVLSLAVSRRDYVLEGEEREDRRG